MASDPRAALGGQAFLSWADARLGGDGPLDAAVLGAGHSNLTFSLARAGAPPYVLRRPPAGPLLPTAHDVLREFRVLSLLRDQDVRVPRVVAACDDQAILGAPFYVMERVEGEVVREDVPDWLGGEQRHALGLDLVAALSELHQVDPEPFVVAGIGRPDGYLARQLSRWTAQREGVQTAVAAAGGRARDLPDYDVLRDWLTDHPPEPVAATVVHGDYKLDNVIVDPATARVRVVIDWEMATVGDPRADLGYLLSFWPEPGEVVPLGMSPTLAGGFPTRAELVSAWESATGREAGDTRWFVTLALWKLAILLEASHHRWLAGMSEDPFFGTLDVGVPQLLSHAREVAGV